MLSRVAERVYWMARYLERAEKTARNISKNTTIIIPAHNIPSFKPAKTFVSVVK